MKQTENDSAASFADTWQLILPPLMNWRAKIGFCRKMIYTPKPVAAENVVLGRQNLPATPAAIVAHRTGLFAAADILIPQHRQLNRGRRFRFIPGLKAGVAWPSSKRAVVSLCYPRRCYKFQAAEGDTYRRSGR